MGLFTKATSREGLCCVVVAVVLRSCAPLLRNTQYVSLSKGAARQQDHKKTQHNPDVTCLYPLFEVFEPPIEPPIDASAKLDVVWLQ